MTTLELIDWVGMDCKLVLKDEDGKELYSCDVFLCSYEPGRVYHVSSMDNHQKAQEILPWEMVLKGQTVLREYDVFTTERELDGKATD